MTDLFMIILLLLIGYIYLGYPVVLCLVAKWFPQPHGFDDAHEPSVTLVISAYNEEKVITSKIENSLQLDYPREKFSIVVVSDCSSDGTDERVKAFEGSGVVLIRADQRRGKTAALNQALEQIDSEVVVFSDANAIYDRSAIRHLVRHFVDPRVGYVVGNARYEEQIPTAAGGSEGVYWDLEIKIKTWESAFSSVVGGDGAIYAIRRNLYQPMLDTDINDFVNPLQIVAKGFRGIFEPQAWCVEQPAGQFKKEFRRKVRIANRSFNALLRVPQVCNPLRVGRFAWQVVSHKLLRWFSPYFLFLLLAALGADRILEPAHLVDRVSIALCGILFTLAAVGWLFDSGKNRSAIFYLPYYFVLMNLASALGIYYRMRGRVISTWDTVRADASEDQGQAPWLPRFVLGTGLTLLLGFGGGLIGNDLWLRGAAFFLLLALVHTYLGYPIVLAALTRFTRKEISLDAGHTPSVTLLIVAYNEEREIEGKLRNCLALDYPRELLRVLVASDGSTDRTNEIVAGFAGQGIDFLPFPVNRGKIAALNDAMKSVTSEIVVLSDANVMYLPDAIRKLVRNFHDPRVGAVSGKVILTSDALSYGAAEKSYYSLEHRIQEREGAAGSLIGADGAMYAIRRSLFSPPGADTILDDLVIAMSIARTGHFVVHEKEAIGFEENLVEFTGEFRRKSRIIAGGFQCLLLGAVLPRLSQPLFLFCFVSHKVLRWISGFLVLALFGVLVQIQLKSGGHDLISGVILCAVTSGVLVALLAQLFPRLKGFRAANFCNYFFMLMLASLVGCYLGVTGRQKVTWRRSAA